MEELEIREAVATHLRFLVLKRGNIYRHIALTAQPISVATWKSTKLLPRAMNSVSEGSSASRRLHSPTTHRQSVALERGIERAIAAAGERAVLENDRLELRERRVIPLPFAYLETEWSGSCGTRSSRDSPTEEETLRCIRCKVPTLQVEGGRVDETVVTELKRVQQGKRLQLERVAVGKGAIADVNNGEV